MKVTCDPESDVLRIVLKSTPVEESDEEKPGIILDYDRDGDVVGIEVLDASKRTENPRAPGSRHQRRSGGPARGNILPP